MVVAQLVERLLPIPEVRGSDPVIGKKLISNINCIEKMKLKKKRPGMAIFKKMLLSLSVDFEAYSNSLKCILYSNFGFEHFAFIK